MADRKYMELPPDVSLMGVLQDDRLVLESLRVKFDQKGVEQTRSNIVLEQNIPNGAGATMELITFPLMKEEGAQFDTEIRLDRTDSFTITSWGVYLGHRTTASLPAATAGVDMLLTGPNPTSIAVGLTDALFWAFQRATLIISADTVTYVPSLMAYGSRNVKTSQAGLDPGGGTNYAADGWDQYQGQTPMIPSITVSGSFKNKIQLKLPRPTATAGITDTETAHVSLVFNGFLNQGGAEFRTAKL